MYLVLGRENCPFCDLAVSRLRVDGREFKYIGVTDSGNLRLRDLLTKDLDLNQVPQIFELVGGYDELVQKLWDEEIEGQL
jgi:glutaredoxin